MQPNELPNGELPTLNAELGRLTERYRAAGKNPGVNKRWLNKVVSRLEEVQLFATQLPSQVQQPVSAANPTVTAGCTCPMPGVIDTQCPVHARAV